MRRATTFDGILDSDWLISIHALHEESDTEIKMDVQPVNISIHALHEESDRVVDNVSRHR